MTRRCWRLLAALVCIACLGIVTLISGITDSAIEAVTPTHANLRGTPGERLPVIFAFRNRSEGPLTVTRILKSCACIEPQVNTPTVAPGETGRIVAGVTVPADTVSGYLIVEFAETTGVYRGTFVCTAVYEPAVYVSPTSVSCIETIVGVPVSVLVVLPPGEAGPPSVPELAGAATMSLRDFSGWRRLPKNRYAASFRLVAEKEPADLPCDVTVRCLLGHSTLKTGQLRIGP